MSDALARELAEYFLGERVPSMPIYSLAKQYVGESKFNLEWSAATTDQAIAAIRRAGELGLLRIENDVVSSPEVKKVEKRNIQLDFWLDGF
jgi:hypothetical protein